MVKEIEELRLKETAAVEEQKKLSRSVRSPIIMIMLMLMLIIIMMVSKQIPPCHIPTWWDYVSDDKGRL